MKRQGTYYWIKTEEENTFRLAGPFVSEYIAQIKADNLDEPYEIISLPTSNIDSAMRMYKWQRSEEQSSWNPAKTRAKRGLKDKFKRLFHKEKEEEE